MPKKYIVGLKNNIFDSLEEAANFIHSTNKVEDWAVGYFLGNVTTQVDLCIQSPDKKITKKIKINAAITSPSLPPQPIINQATRPKNRPNVCTFDNNPSVKTVKTPEGIPVNICELHLELEAPLIRGDWDINELS